MIYPTHVILLLLATGAAGTILYWFFAQIGLRRSSMSGKRAWQIGATIFLAALLALALSFSLTGRYTAQNANAGGLVPLLITLMVASNIFLLVVAPPYRQMVDAIPLHWLIASHVLRIIPGIIFLALYDMRLLPPDVSLQAGYGDILSGLVAVPVAYMIYRWSANVRAVAFIWAIFGLFDLINALYLGQTTIPAWTAALSRTGQPIEFINLFLMLPTFMVPLYLVSHIWIFRRLFSLKADAPLTAQEARLPA